MICRLLLCQRTNFNLDNQHKLSTFSTNTTTTPTTRHPSFSKRGLISHCHFQTFKQSKTITASMGSGSGSGPGLGGTQSYGEPSYWDKRYSEEETPFDWYQKYSSLAPLLHLYLSPQHHRILVIGCGNSTFSEGMADDGYEEIVNIDISSVVIEAMQKKYSNHAKLKYVTMDARNMDTFQPGSFDAVIDKGTLDSLLCGNNSKDNSTKMLEEIGRVLKDKGIYILITYGAPSYRLNLLKSSYKWKIKLHVIEKTLFSVKNEEQRHTWELTKPVPLCSEGKSIEDFIGKNPDVHYIYICTKDDSLSHGGIDATVA